MGFVIAVTVNGVRASTVRRQLLLAGRRPSKRLLDRATSIAVTSQLCWWGAATIGFVNARS
jgi:hypothetical protein